MPGIEIEIVFDILVCFGIHFAPYAVVVVGIFLFFVCFFLFFFVFSFFCFFFVVFFCLFFFVFILIFLQYIAKPLKRGNM